MANSNPPDHRYGGPAGKDIPRVRQHHPQYHQQQQQHRAHLGGGGFTPPPVPPPVTGAAAAATLGMGMPILISVVMLILILLLARIYVLRMWKGFLRWAVPSNNGMDVPVQSPRSSGMKRD